MNDNDMILGGLKEGQRQIERRVGAIDTRLDGIDRRLTDQDVVLKEIRDGIYVARGALKWFVRLGIGGSAIGTGISRAWDWIKHR